MELAASNYIGRQCAMAAYLRCAFVIIYIGHQSNTWDHAGFWQKDRYVKKRTHRQHMGKEPGSLGIGEVLP